MWCCVMNERCQYLYHFPYFRMLSMKLRVNFKPNYSCSSGGDYWSKMQFHRTIPVFSRKEFSSIFSIILSLTLKGMQRIFPKKNRIKHMKNIKKNNLCSFCRQKPQENPLNCQNVSNLKRCILVHCWRVPQSITPFFRADKIIMKI